MTQQCKVWFVPVDRFRGLCSQSYDPMTGTDECPVCVEPYMMDEVIDCGPCLTTDEFSPVYKIKTPFNPPTTKIDGGLYTLTRSASQTSGMGAPRNHTVTYNRYLYTLNWDDLSGLWNAPLVRIQKPADPYVSTPNGCYENVCTWVGQLTQVIGFRELPYVLYIGCSYPGAYDQFFRSQTKTRWPKSLVASPWNTSHNGYPCRFYSDIDAFYHFARATNSAGLKPSYLPDQTEKWPSGFDSLSSNPIQGYSKADYDLRYVDNGAPDYNSPCNQGPIQKAVRGIMNLNIRLSVFTTTGAKIFWRLSISHFYFEVYWATVKNNLSNIWEQIIPVYGGPEGIIPFEDAGKLLGPQPDNPNWLEPHVKGPYYYSTGRHEYSVNYRSDPMVCSGRGLVQLNQEPLNQTNPYPQSIIVKAGS